LGGPSHESFDFTSFKGGASIRIGKASLAGAGYPHRNCAAVQRKAGSGAGRNGSRRAGNFLLAPSAGDQFFNYNGAGSEAPKDLYKLRWFLVAPPGRYCAEIDVKPTPAKAGLDLVVDGQRIPLIVPSSDAATVTIMQNIRVVPPRSGNESPVRVELTPPEPFLKGTQLPGVVLAVRQVRER
jgi:hypothetical protein